MNRGETTEEIITNIQNKLNRAYMMKDREKVDEIIGIVFDEVEKLRQAKKFECKKFECKKIEPKKYYLQLKFKYNDFLCKRENETYINLNSADEYFLDLKDNIYTCQTQFTDEEIKNIKLPEPLTLDMFEKKEVE